jgi:hypothetical protein
VAAPFNRERKGAEELRDDRPGTSAPGAGWSAYRRMHGTHCRQKELIRRMAQQGQSTEVAEATLEAWQASLQAFERHRQQIVSRLDAKKSHP